MSGQRVVLVELQSWEDEEIYTILFLAKEPPMTVGDFQQIVQKFLPHLTHEAEDTPLDVNLSQIHGCIPGTDCVVVNVDFTDHDNLPVLEFTGEGRVFQWQTVGLTWEDDDDDF